MIRIAHTLLAATGIVLAAPVLAQTATPQSIKAATALVELTSPAAAANAQIEAQLKQMREGNTVRAILSQSPQLRMELAKNQPATNAGISRVGTAQAETMAPILREMQEAGRKASIDAYAREFTAAELEAILQFYRSPAGAKLLKKQRPMTIEVGKEVQGKFAPRLQTAEKSIAARLESEMPKMFPQLVPKSK